MKWALLDSDNKPVISLYDNNLEYEMQYKLCINFEWNKNPYKINTDKNTVRNIYETLKRIYKKINYVKWSFIISLANFAKFSNSLELSELNNWHILKVFGRIL